MDTLREKAKSVANGKKGLTYGLPANVLDAAILLKQCWEDLPASVIAGCWSRSRCLSTIKTAELVSDSREYHSKLANDAISDICNLFSGRSLVRQFVQTLFTFKFCGRNGL